MGPSKLRKRSRPRCVEPEQMFQPGSDALVSHIVSFFGGHQGVRCELHNQDCDKLAKHITTRSIHLSVFWHSKIHPTSIRIGSDLKAQLDQPSFNKTRNQHEPTKGLLLSVAVPYLLTKKVLKQVSTSFILLLVTSFSLKILQSKVGF